MEKLSIEISFWSYSNVLYIPLYMLFDIVKQSELLVCFNTAFWFLVATSTFDFYLGMTVNTVWKCYGIKLFGLLLEIYSDQKHLFG